MPTTILIPTDQLKTDPIAKEIVDRLIKSAEMQFKYIDYKDCKTRQGHSFTVMTISTEPIENI